MIVKVPSIDRIRNFIEHSCGILVDPEKNYLIETRLAKLLDETQSKNYDEFYYKIIDSNDGKLREQIIDAITTNETLWFRDTRIWNTLEKVIIPRYLDQIKTGEKRKIRVWSSAASTGQEAYSFAMLLDKVIGTNILYKDIKPDTFEIIATDISSSALFLANAARYGRIEMKRGLPNFYLTRYFERTENVFQLNDQIKKRVKFSKFNLQNDLSIFGHFDIVMCRNVVIYFSDTLKRSLFSRIAKSLNKNGCCILGASESLTEYSTDFTFQKDETGSIYYQLK